MSYRFNIICYPAIKQGFGFIVYDRTKTEVVDSGTIERANDSGFRKVVNILKFHADHKNSGCQIPTTRTHGWRYAVDWLDKPRIRRFHNLYINVFAAE